MLELDQASAIVLAHLMSKQSGDIDVRRLEVSENGTYKESGKAYSPVVVNVPQIETSELDVVANGTYTPDTNQAYSKVVVNVPNPSTGSTNITTNGTHDVTDYASAVVAVPQGEPIEVSTSEGMTAVLVVENVGKVFRFTGETTADYIHGDLYIVEEAE